MADDQLKRIDNDITTQFRDGRSVTAYVADGALRSSIRRRARLASAACDDETVRLLAVMWDLLDRIDGYKATIARLTEFAPSNGVETSDAAAKETKRTLTKNRLKVMGPLIERGSATCGEMERILGLAHERVSPIFHGIEKAGWVERPGDKRPHPVTGNPALVYYPTDEGRRVYAEYVRTHDLGVEADGGKLQFGV